MSYTPHFSVSDYGAKGDGTTDDTTAIQAALNAAHAANGSVLVHSGTFYTGPLTVPANVQVIGTGNHQSTFKLKNGLVNNTTTVSLVTLGSGSVLENLVLDGNQANNPGPAEYSTSVVQIPSGANGAQVINCKVSNSANYGVFAYNATDVVVLGCELSGHQFYAIFAQQSCHRLRVKDNYFHSLASSAIKVHASDSQQGNINTTAENPIITNNVIDYRGQTMADSNQLAIELFDPSNNQTLTITATGGTYTLQVAPSGTTTAAIAYNATASAIQSALTTAGLVAAVTGTGPYVITINGEFLQVNTGSLTGGSATITATLPPTGVFGGVVSGNQIWGPTGGTNTIFGISLGGCTNTKCSDNTVYGTLINIGIEAANATRPVIRGNSIDGPAYGFSLSGTTYQPIIEGNNVQNCPTYGAQLYGNTSGTNQGSVVQAQISGNTFIDCGTNNAQFCTLYFNGTGRGSIVANNSFVIKDSAEDIRAIDIFSSNYTYTEFITIQGNLCYPHPLGTSGHGYGLVQSQGSRFLTITDNVVYGGTPTGANAGIEGITLVESGGAGHLVKGNLFLAVAKSINDVSSGGAANIFIGNASYNPTLADFVFTSQDVAQGNLVGGVAVADQHTQDMAYAAKTGAYTLSTSDSVITADATTAAFTVTLPAANAVPAGREFRIKKIDSSANNVTVAVNGTPGTDTIDGASSKALSTQYQTLTLVSDGSSKYFIF